MWNKTLDDYVAETYDRCPICGEYYDPEDAKVCTDCGRVICRNADCGGVCGFEDDDTICDEYVCCECGECGDQDGHCHRCQLDEIPNELDRTPTPAAEPLHLEATEGHS